MSNSSSLFFATLAFVSMAYAGFAYADTSGANLTQSKHLPAGYAQGKKLNTRGANSSRSSARVYYGHTGSTVKSASGSPVPAFPGQTDYTAGHSARKKAKSHTNTVGIAGVLKRSNGWELRGNLAHIHGGKAPTAGETAHGLYAQAGIGKTWRLSEGGAPLSIFAAPLVGYSSFHYAGHTAGEWAPGGLFKARWRGLSLSYIHEAHKNRDGGGNTISSPHTIRLGYEYRFVHGPNVHMHAGVVIPQAHLGNDYSISDGWLVSAGVSWPVHAHGIRSTTLSVGYTGGLRVKEHGGSEPGWTIPMAVESVLPYDPRHPTQSYQQGLQLAASARLPDRLTLTAFGGFTPTINSTVHPLGGSAVKVSTSGYNAGVELQRRF